MKKILKRLLALILLLPLNYLLIALLLTYITVNEEVKAVREESIYLKSNGIHLDLILPSTSIKIVPVKSKYISIGWGDKDFYLKTPSFNDLTFSTAFKALLLKSESLLHLTNYNKVDESWIEIRVSTEQLNNMANQINEQFDSSNLRPIKGYHSNDFFYASKGSYSCFFTCNSWVNSILKKAKLKACIWTPFSFRLLNLYELK